MASMLESGTEFNSEDDTFLWLLRGYVTAETSGVPEGGSTPPPEIHYAN
jgi:hypothetical protein